MELSETMSAALVAEAARRNVSPEDLLDSILRAYFARQNSPLVPQDDWERLLLSGAIDCGVSLSNEAVSSDGIYD